MSDGQPTMEELKTSIDVLNAKAVGYVVRPTAQALQEAKLARQIVHSGLFLVFDELEKLRAQHRP